MKANEMPERIYIFDYNDAMVTPLEGDTTYVMEDAFIEKVEDFIRRKICDYIVHYNYGPNNDMETMYVDSRFFDDFKNYMKE